MVIIMLFFIKSETVPKNPEIFAFIFVRNLWVFSFFLLVSLRS